MHVKIVQELSLSYIYDDSSFYTEKPATALIEQIKGEKQDDMRKQETRWQTKVELKMTLT